MTNELRLTTELAPSINHCYYTARTGMRLLTKDALAWIGRTKVIAAKAAKEQGWTMTTDEKIVVDIMTYWKDRRRHDVHNGIKNLADSLEGIVYKDDKMLLPRYIDFALDRDNPRLEMIFRRFNPEIDTWEDFKCSK